MSGIRSGARTGALLGSIALGSLLLTGCTTNSAGSLDSVVSTAVDTEAIPPTIPAVISTTPTTITTATATTTTTTTLEGPQVPVPSLARTTSTGRPPDAVTTTTVAHGLGFVTTTNEGVSIPDDLASTASSIYEAVLRRDYPRLAFIIGDRRFHWGFVGERKPAESWEKDFAAGANDVVPRIIALLETRPGTDIHGAAVWPYLAIKAPAEWTTDDEAVALSLGMTAGTIEQMRLKNRYLEYRLVIDAEGNWTGFYLGE